MWQLSSIFSIFKKEPEAFKNTVVLESGPKKAYHRKYRKHASAELHKNLNAAEWIFNKTKAKIPHSSNYQSRTLDIDDPANEKLCQKMRSEQILIGCLSKKPLELLQYFEKTKAAVCEDLAFVGMLYAMQHHIKVNIERVNIRTGRHTFLVIGRDKNSDPTNHKTWGHDCVICDIWAGKYYPVSEFEKEMVCYVSNENYFIGAEVRGQGQVSCPRVRPFDSKTDKLLLLEAQFSKREKHEILNACTVKEKTNTRTHIMTTKAERVAVAEALKHKR